MIRAKSERASRRSSILKPSKARQPLQNVDFNTSSSESSPATSKLKRRVSFAEKKHVKEFCNSVDQGTVWDNTYEESESSFQKLNSPSDGNGIALACQKEEVRTIVEVSEKQKHYTETVVKKPSVCVISAETTQTGFFLRSRQSDCNAMQCELDLTDPIGGIVEAGTSEKDKTVKRRRGSKSISSKETKMEETILFEEEAMEFTSIVSLAPQACHCVGKESVSNTSNVAQCSGTATSTRCILDNRAPNTKDCKQSDKEKGFICNDKVISRSASVEPESAIEQHGNFSSKDEMQFVPVASSTGLRLIPVSSQNIAQAKENVLTQSRFAEENLINFTSEVPLTSFYSNVRLGTPKIAAFEKENILPQQEFCDEDEMESASAAICTEESNLIPKVILLEGKYELSQQRSMPVLLTLSNALVEKENLQQGDPEDGMDFTSVIPPTNSDPKINLSIMKHNLFESESGLSVENCLEHGSAVLQDYFLPAASSKAEQNVPFNKEKLINPSVSQQIGFTRSEQSKDAVLMAGKDIAGDRSDLTDLSALQKSSFHSNAGSNVSDTNHPKNLDVIQQLSTAGNEQISDLCPMAKRNPPASTESVIDTAIIRQFGSVRKGLYSDASSTAKGSKPVNRESLMDPSIVRQIGSVQKEEQCPNPLVLMKRNELVNRENMIDLQIVRRVTHFPESMMLSVNYPKDQGTIHQMKSTQNEQVSINFKNPEDVGISGTTTLVPITNSRILNKEKAINVLSVPLELSTVVSRFSRAESNKDDKESKKSKIKCSSMCLDPLMTKSEISSFVSRASVVKSDATLERTRTLTQEDIEEMDKLPCKSANKLHKLLPKNAPISVNVARDSSVRLGMDGRNMTMTFRDDAKFGNVKLIEEEGIHYFESSMDTSNIRRDVTLEKTRTVTAEDIEEMIVSHIETERSRCKVNQMDDIPENVSMEMTAMVPQSVTSMRRSDFRRNENIEMEGIYCDRNEKTEVFQDMPMEMTEGVRAFPWSVVTPSGNHPQRNLNDVYGECDERTRVFQNVSMEMTAAVPARSKNIEMDEACRGPSEKTGMFQNVSMEMTEALPRLATAIGVDDILRNKIIEMDGIYCDRNEKTEIFQDMPMEMTEGVRAFPRSVVSPSGNHPQRNPNDVYGERDKRTRIFQNVSMEMTAAVPARSKNIEMDEACRGPRERTGMFQNVSMEMTEALPRLATAIGVDDILRNMNIEIDPVGHDPTERTTVFQNVSVELTMAIPKPITIVRTNNLTGSETGTRKMNKIFSNTSKEMTSDVSPLPPEKIDLCQTRLACTGKENEVPSNTTIKVISEFPTLPQEDKVHEARMNIASNVYVDALEKRSVSNPACTRQENEVDVAHTTSVNTNLAAASPWKESDLHWRNLLELTPKTSRLPLSVNSSSKRILSEKRARSKLIQEKVKALTGKPRISLAKSLLEQEEDPEETFEFLIEEMKTMNKSPSELDDKEESLAELNEPFVNNDKKISKAPSSRYTYVVTDPKFIKPGSSTHLGLLENVSSEPIGVISHLFDGPCDAVESFQNPEIVSWDSKRNNFTQETTKVENCQSTGATSKPSMLRSDTYIIRKEDMDTKKLDLKENLNKVQDKRKLSVIFSSDSVICTENVNSPSGTHCSLPIDDTISKEDIILCTEDVPTSPSYQKDPFQFDAEDPFVMFRQECRMISRMIEAAIEEDIEEEDFPTEECPEFLALEEDNGEIQNSEQLLNEVCPVKEINEESSAAVKEDVVNKDYFDMLAESIETFNKRKDCIWDIRSLKKELISLGYMSSSLVFVILFQNNIDGTANTIQTIKIVSRLTEKAEKMIKIVHRLIIDKINPEDLVKSFRTHQDVMPLIEHFSTEVKLAIDFMYELKRLENSKLMEVDIDRIRFTIYTKRMDIVLNIVMQLKPFNKLNCNDIEVACVLGSVRINDIKQLITNVKKDHLFLRRYMNDVRQYIELMEDSNSSKTFR